MEITLSSPALLFPAISLLMLAYTNRFLALASLIRGLHVNYKKDKDPVLEKQIFNLRTRLYLIRSMQAWGMASLISCIFCMFAVLGGGNALGFVFMIVALFAMLYSLILSLREIVISVDALNIASDGIGK